MLGRIRLTCLLVTSACAAAPKPAPESPASPTAAATVAQRQPGLPAVAAAPADPRRLAEHSTFADLARIARRLDDQAETHSDKACLLYARDGLRLDADVSLAARPLPEPPMRVLEGSAREARGVSVMSTWGTVVGQPTDSLLLVFTTTSPSAIKLPAIGLFATQSGVLIRSALPALQAQQAAVHPEEAGRLLAQSSSPAAVYVTADGDYEVGALLALLKLIPNRYEVALAVSLPSSTRLPAAAIDPGLGLCPGGLPEPGASEREGELSRTAAQSAVAPLREAALSCALQSRGRALLGGKLLLAMRISADGKVREACFPSDGIGEPLLRRCLIATAKDMRLPQPSPAGFADLQLPLQLELTGPPPQRATCD